ncbi:extracellular serine protease [Geomicrobium sp. JCM 19037]|uniref:S8 family serine peptidase n=1 Tax=Geomicrobium sp. JCM 19037 TaxID=1460634 RepID=UPI00045F2DD0|nr:S8 family serine peptidase [Geomicrobium sp. JCM 19037]GAK02669.1 extracellular serine protease [Geomicrobium sp. JCM 19037]
MKKFKTFALSSIFFLLASSALPYAATAEEAEKAIEAQIFGVHDFTSSQTKTVIVELEEKSELDARQSGERQSRSVLTDERNRVLNDIEVNVSSVDVVQEYGYVFSGFSIDLPEDEIPQLLTIDGVKAVYPDVEYEVDTIGEDIAIAEEEFSPDMLDSGPFIGNQEAFDMGYTGEGVTVAVIDTGVDYTHPDLAPAFGSYKGYDFVDNNEDPQETPPGDPRGGSTDHGTHVAGTVAGSGLVTGIAPDANLLAYRVLGPGGSGTTANVIAGIEQAVLDGADVMNLSLGNTLNDPDFATSIALDVAMADGVVAVTSNGNSGPENWTVGSPGTSREAISVGATQLPFAEYTAAMQTETGSYPSAEVMGFSNELDLLRLNEGEYEFFDAGIGAPEDFEDVDAEGNIALMVRGDLPFVEKAENAADAGAVGAIIYNNVEGAQPDVPGLDIPTVKLSLQDGQAMLDALANGDNTVSFDFDFDREVGETVADFSSRGPVMFNWMIKPDVSAPGVSIVSTVPTHDSSNPHGYSSKQGTSMSAPHVAGAAAILLDADPDASVEHVRAALMNTAETLVDADGNTYPHNTQGTGSIRIPDAINVDSTVMPGTHSFGIFNEDEGVQTKRSSFTINNVSDQRQAYGFSIEFDGNPSGISAMTSSDIALQPGQSGEVRLNIQVNPDLLDSGYYEGMITVESLTDTIEVPTILFVDEPDYPRITSLDVLDTEKPNEFDLVANVPRGAEELGFWLYDAETGNYLGLADSYTDVAGGTFEETYDATHLDAGDYVMIGYAEYLEQTNTAQSDVFTVVENDEDASQPEPTPDPENPPLCEHNAWSSSSIYVGGDRVEHNGNFYEAKWWTQGEDPEQSGQWDVWKIASDCTEPDEDHGYPAWSTSDIYVGGDRVLHDGQLFEAKWWTQGENPNNSGQWDVWKKVSE